MGHSTVEYEKLEKIKAIILVNRWNVEHTVADVTKLFGRPVAPQYIKDLIERMQRRINREVIDTVSVGMVQYVMMMHESEMIHHYDALRDFKNLHFAMVSVCCKMPMNSYEDVHYCVSCKKETTPIKITLYDNIEVRRKIVQDIHQSVIDLVDMVLDLRDGRNNRGADRDPPGAAMQQQINIFTGKQQKKRVLHKDDAVMIQNMQTMPSIEREQVIKRIEAQIMHNQLKELEDAGIIDPLPKEEQAEPPKEATK